MQKGENAIMKCPKCGTENAAEALYCANCGSPLEAPAPAPPQRLRPPRLRPSTVSLSTTAPTTPGPSPSSPLSSRACERLHAADLSAARPAALQALRHGGAFLRLHLQRLRSAQVRRPEQGLGGHHRARPVASPPSLLRRLRRRSHHGYRRAVVFGIIGLFKSTRRGMSLAGLICGAVGIVFGTLWSSAWSRFQRS